jgi:hypothetical protein
LKVAVLESAASDLERWAGQEKFVVSDKILAFLNMELIAGILAGY